MLATVNLRSATSPAEGANNAAASEEADLLIKILIRLPVKSLLRFTSVSKSWYSLIRSPYFIPTHLNHNKNRNNQILISNFNGYHCYGGKEYYYAYRDNGTFDKLATLHVPFTCKDGTFRVLGSSNGLVFFCDDEFGCKQTMYLWNPSIRKFITIPTPKVTIESHGPFDHALGFGFDATTNDYKIVRLAFLQSNNIGALLKVELYELSTGSWRSINVGDFKYVVDRRDEDHAFLNGVIHWIGHEKDGFFPEFIVTFDMKNEELGVMMMPPSLVWPLSIFVFRDSLYLTEQIQTDKHYGIWVMNDYGVAESWTKVINIDMYDYYWAPPFGFRDNGDVLLSRIRSWFGHAVRDLVSYDPKKKQIKKLGILGHPRCFYEDNYVESLVLINDLSDVLVRKEISCDAKVVCKEEAEEQDDDNDDEGKRMKT